MSAEQLQDLLSRVNKTIIELPEGFATSVMEMSAGIKTLIDELVKLNTTADGTARTLQEVQRLNEEIASNSGTIQNTPLAVDVVRFLKMEELESVLKRVDQAIVQLPEGFVDTMTAMSGGVGKLVEEMTKLNATAESTAGTLKTLQEANAALGAGGVSLENANLSLDLSKLEPVISRISEAVTALPEGFMEAITGISSGVKSIIDEIAKLNQVLTGTGDGLKDMKDASASLADAGTSNQASGLKVDFSELAEVIKRVDTMMVKLPEDFSTTVTEMAGNIK